MRGERLLLLLLLGPVIAQVLIDVLVAAGGRLALFELTDKWLLRLGLRLVDLEALACALGQQEEAPLVLLLLVLQ